MYTYTYTHTCIYTHTHKHTCVHIQPVNLTPIRDAPTYKEVMDALSSVKLIPASGQYAYMHACKYVCMYMCTYKEVMDALSSVKLIPASDQDAYMHVCMHV